MKLRIRKFVAIGLTLMLSSTAWADVIINDGSIFDGTNVGDPDTLAGWTTKVLLNAQCGPGNSPTVEECWAESITGTDLVFAGKTNTVPYYGTDAADTLAFQLAFGGGYYLVKNSTFYALMDNVANFDWGVLNVSVLPSGFNLDFDEGDAWTISHVTEWDGDGECCTQVPEPGTLALLGLGLVGLGLTRRRQRI